MFFTIRLPSPVSEVLSLLSPVKDSGFRRTPVNPKVGPREKALTFLFGVTLFVSAALLFSVQPMVAKMLLPLLGGTPAVWNTCMLFFQAALLAGYGYALIASKWS